MTSTAMSPVLSQFSSNKQNIARNTSTWPVVMTLREIVFFKSSRIALHNSNMVNISVVDKVLFSECHSMQKLPAFLSRKNFEEYCRLIQVFYLVGLFYGLSIIDGLSHAELNLTFMDSNNISLKSCQTDK